MNAVDYQNFTDSLTQVLASDSRVLGLIAVGSMSKRDYQPDDWSDHDFFVIVQSGSQETFRTNFQWLPNSSEVVFSFRETEHGLKVLYRNGHLLEFAVFDLDELRLARVNRSRILLDKGRVQQRLNDVISETKRWSQEALQDDRYHFGQFLTNLLVASGRYARGERLSGLKFLYGGSIKHLILLICKYLPTENISTLDNIDPLRRFEFAYPDLSRALSSSLNENVSDSARKLLRIADEVLRNRMPDYPVEAVRAVESRLHP